MADFDSENAELQTKIASLKARLTSPSPSTEPIGYTPKQLAYDVGTGALKGFTGLADLITTPGVAIARAGGIDMPYFGISKMLESDLQTLAPQYGLQEGTMPQEVVSYVTPTGPGKLVKQAGTGLAAYVGAKTGEAIDPENPYYKLAGALLGSSALTAGTKMTSAIAPTVEDVGMGLQRKARGARASDYTLNRNAIIETVQGEPTTQLKKSFNNLIKEGTLGRSIDPEAMYPKLQIAKEETENAIQATLQKTEAQVGPVPPPSFDKTVNYVSKNIAANDVEKYLDEVITLQDALRREGKGSLVYLNQQKKVIGENWKNSPQSDPGFWRALYGDIKQHIEKYAPEVKDLNKQKQDLIVVSPIIERGFKASGATYDIDKVQQLLNTTRGAGLAGGALLGAAAGDMGTGILGALTLRALSTPRGQNLVGKLATGLSSALPKTTVTSSIPELLSRGILAFNSSSPISMQADKAEETSIPQYINARDEEFKIEQDVLNKFVDPDKLKTKGMDKYDLIKDETKLNKVIDEETKRKRDAGIGTLYTQEGKAPVFVLSGDRTPKELLATDQGIKIQPGVKLKDGISTPELPAAKSTSLEDENIALEAKIAAYKKQFGIKNETATTAGKQEISAIIDDVATKYKVPAAELKAIAKIESDFNPNAIGPKTRFGQAEGAMQLMPATAKALEVKDPFDPRQSIEGASKLLLQLENTFGEYNDRRFIWAAYNSRPALVKNAIRKVKADGDKVTWGNVSKYMPPETKDYVRNISNLV